MPILRPLPDQVSSESSRQIVEILDLLDLVSLDNIVMHEERGRRISWVDGEVESLDLPKYVNSMGIAVTDTDVAYRFRMVFADENAEYVSDVEALYGLSEPVDISDEVKLEFAERVAFMAVYPYLRASIYGSAARLGQPIPVLAIIRQGDFSTGGPIPEADAATIFDDTVSELAHRP